MTWKDLINEVKDFKDIQIVDGDHIQHNGLIFCADLSIACAVQPYGRLEQLDRAKSLYHMKQIILALTDGESKQEYGNW